MTVVGNFYFYIFLRLTWEFLSLESEYGGSVYWPNNKIIDNTWFLDPCMFGTALNLLHLVQECHPWKWLRGQCKEGDCSLVPFRCGRVEKQPSSLDLWGLSFEILLEVWFPLKLSFSLKLSVGSSCGVMSSVLWYIEQLNVPEGWSPELGGIRVFFFVPALIF